MLTVPGSLLHFCVFKVRLIAPEVAAQTCTQSCPWVRRILAWVQLPVTCTSHPNLTANPEPQSPTPSWAPASTTVPARVLGRSPDPYRAPNLTPNLNTRTPLCRGQDIRSPMSHKSYRPLTTLSFRLQHWASTRLMPAGGARSRGGSACCTGCLCRQGGGTGSSCRAGLDQACAWLTRRLGGVAAA